MSFQKNSPVPETYSNNVPGCIPDTSPEFFKRLYQNSEDPWNFRHSTYERARYHAIIDGINDKSYASIFEAGCSVGELTALLAEHCRSLTAIDCSDTAVETAKSRCQKYPHVDIRQGALPDDIPKHRCDLIVFSEIGYYFSCEDLTAQITQLWSLLTPGGRLIACHWLGHSEDHLLHGAKVHETIGHALRVNSDFNRLDNGYALQRWSKSEL
jgi:trans-aconitate methyltransferase